MDHQWQPSLIRELEDRVQASVEQFELLAARMQLEPHSPRPQRSLRFGQWLRGGVQPTIGAQQTRMRASEPRNRLICLTVAIGLLERKDHAARGPLSQRRHDFLRCRLKSGGIVQSDVNVRVEGTQAGTAWWSASSHGMSAVSEYIG